MIYSVRGTLIITEQNFAVVECGGVGYKCYVTLNTLRLLPKIGEEVMLYTYMSVREDAMELFGFKEKDEMNCYKMLISVSGVGPKVGLAILSTLSAEQVAIAICTGDSKSLTKAAGVGPKLAQRIVLELKDKFKNFQPAAGGTMPIAAQTPMGAGAEAVSALMMLGYSNEEATKLVSQIDVSLPVEQIIGLALKQAGKRK